MCLDGKRKERVSVGCNGYLIACTKGEYRSCRHENWRQIIRHVKRKRLSHRKEREPVLYPSQMYQRVRIPQDKGVGLFWTCIYGNNCLRTWMLCALLGSDYEIRFTTILNNSGCQTMCTIRLKFKTYSPLLLDHTCDLSHRSMKRFKRNYFFLKIFVQSNTAARPCELSIIQTPW